MNTIASNSYSRRIDRLQRNQALPSLAITALLVFAMSAFPESAYAQDIISEKAESAMEWIKTAVYFILVVAVLGSGVMASFGRMSWATVGQVLVGAIVAGLATEVVDALYGA